MRLAKIQRQTEYKDWGPKGSIKADGVQGTISGYLGHFHNVDSQLDVILPGAFTQTIKDAKARRAAQQLDWLFPLLWNHDFSILPVGGIADAWEDAKGLMIRASLNLGTQMGKEMYESCRAGFTPKMSIGYKTLQSEFVKGADGKMVRQLKEIQLMEGSIVNFPANDLAQITSVKSQSRRNFFMPHRTLSKDFDARYLTEQLDDWAYSDWNDVASALHQSILDLFAPGGDPEADLETDVVPGLVTALRAYIQNGVALGYTPSQDSQDSYAMMSSALSQEAKSGYLSVSGHSKIKEASTMIMKHVKVIQSELANVQAANARQRAADLAGWPVYGQSSSSSWFPTKDEEDLAAIKLSSMVTSLEVSNDLREIREMNADLRDASSVSAGVDSALQALINSQRPRR